MDSIDVSVRVSRQLALLLAVTHAAAIIAVAVTPLPLPLRLVACSLLLASAVVSIRRHAVLSAADSVLRLRLRRDGSCQLHTRDGQVIDARLLPGWFTSPLLIVIRLACAGERLPRGMALLADAADGEDLRQLRIFLRFAVRASARHQ